MKKRAFLIDDDKNIVELFKYILEREGFEVVVSYDGGEAAKKIQEVKPDVVILDLMLPNQGGFQILKILQKDPETEKIPVMVITGKFTDGTTYDFVKSQSNVKGYYPKPIDPAVFALEVKKVLGG